MSTVSINVDNIANTISRMKNSEIETLLLLLTEDGKELLKRKRYIEQKKIKTLSRDKVFNV